MPPRQNRQVILKSRPHGIPQSGHFEIVDAPLAETAIVGACAGAAMMGLRPVAEMQFADFISCGFDQIVNQAATLRYRYGGRASVPIVVRAPSGGNVGGGLYHSQNPEGWFIHRPGLKVVAPSTPYDAKQPWVPSLEMCVARSRSTARWKSGSKVASYRSRP